MSWYSFEHRWQLFDVGIYPPSWHCWHILLARNGVYVGISTANVEHPRGVTQGLRGSCGGAAGQTCELTAKHGKAVAGELRL